MKQLCILGVAGIILVGCGSKGTAEYKPKEPRQIPVAAVAAGAENTLFPMVVGNRWKYQIRREAMMANGQRSNVTEEVAMEVKAVEPITDGVRATVEMSKNDVPTDVQIWEVTKNGIFQARIGIEKPFDFTPIQPAFTFPFKPGDTFSYKGKGPTPFGEIGDIESTSTIDAPEEVDTLLERVSAFRVATKTKMTAKPGSSEEETFAWWSPNVGLVKYEQNVRATAGGKPAAIAKVTMTLMQKQLKSAN